MGIIKEAINDAKIKISSLWNKSYIKIIVICVSIVVCFSSGLFTGCGRLSEVERELTLSEAYGKEMARSNSELQDNIRRAESELSELREDKQGLLDTNYELGEENKQFKSALVEFQRQIILSELSDRETARIIDESLDIIEKYSD